MGAETMLTRREKQVLTLMANGYMIKEMASELGLSFFTVRNYKRNILVKLRALNSSHAVALAFKNKDLKGTEILGER